MLCTYKRNMFSEARIPTRFQKKKKRIAKCRMTVKSGRTLRHDTIVLEVAPMPMGFDRLGP